MHGLTTICDKVIDGDMGKDVVAKSNNEAKSYNETNFNEKKATNKTQKFYVLFPFLLITIAL